ncbi:MAG: hypothetical protein DRR04_06555 [Gammaproteobacteria bacterium]|nr:MAG: hypothetical protein DRQ98_03735 [Gammaproteobacteria bacterium]RLA60142.1 MAG: hypothetical protein DRR04_06555 [Gammaproteobacteria bacterium]
MRLSFFRFIITHSKGSFDPFNGIPAAQGHAASRTIGNLVYACLTGNTVMSDGKGIFHADHGGNTIADALDIDGVAMKVRMDAGTLEGENTPGFSGMFNPARSPPHFYVKGTPGGLGHKGARRRELSLFMKYF